MVVGPAEYLVQTGTEIYSEEGDWCRNPEGMPSDHSAGARGYSSR